MQSWRVKEVGVFTQYVINNKGYYQNKYVKYMKWKWKCKGGGGCSKINVGFQPLDTTFGTFHSLIPEYCKSGVEWWTKIYLIHLNRFMGDGDVITKCRSSRMSKTEDPLYKIVILCRFDGQGQSTKMTNFPPRHVGWICETSSECDGVWPWTSGSACLHVNMPYMVITNTAT